MRLFPLAATAALCFTALTTALTPARAVEPLREHDVVLLQPGTVIERRVDGGADALADYLKRLAAAASDTMRAHPQQIPTAGFIVVAVRPGGRTHAWFDFKPALGPGTAAALAQVVETVAPTPLKQGPLVFALRVSLWSDKPPAAYAPAPPEWREAARAAGHRLELDALIDQLWPQ